jgi:hypothetical protein
MRFGLVILLCLLNTACAIVRKDKEEPVEDVPTRRSKAETVLKPSEVLKPKGLEIASPVSDSFYMRVTYFPASVTTNFAIDPAQNVQGTTLSGEKDLGWDDRIDQGRMEVDFRLKKRHHLRVDYFKLSRFSEQPMPRDIQFGNFFFPEGTNFRSKLDLRVLTITHTYQFFKFDRWEAGGGLGFHIVQAQAEGGTPGTLNKEEISEVGYFPTIAVNGAFRISKRWSVTVRGQYFSATPEDFEGSMADYHADIQYRWRKNFAVGIGYTKLAEDLVLVDRENPVLYDLDTSGPELFFRVSF